MTLFYTFPTVNKFLETNNVLLLNPLKQTGAQACCFLLKMLMFFLFTFSALIIIPVNSMMMYVESKINCSGCVYEGSRHPRPVLENKVQIFKYSLNTL